jgi:hypothetical protein
MARLGAFDAQLRRDGLFDPTLLAVGWYEWGLPFSHSLIDAAAGGQIVAVGQASESDTARAIAWAPKHRLVGQASEADTAQAVAWAPKHRLVGQASEVDLAQTITVIVGGPPSAALRPYGDSPWRRRFIFKRFYRGTVWYEATAGGDNGYLTDDG